VKRPAASPATNRFVERDDRVKAFSSEVDTGSREENASKQEI